MKLLTDDFKFINPIHLVQTGSSVLIGGGSSRTVGGLILDVEGRLINDSSISMISNGDSDTDGSYCSIR